MDTNKIINELPKLFDKIAKDFEEWNMKLFKNEGIRLVSIFVMYLWSPFF
jgi:hypothetical protein